MTEWIGPRNPLVYARFHSRGSWRGHLIAVALIGAILAGLMILSAEFANDPATAMSYWANGLLWGQSTILGIAAMIGVSSAIRTDIASGMTDSLRLMPAGPAIIVLGYVVGGMTSGLSIYLPCLIAGTIASSISQVGPGPFLFASLLLTSSTIVLILFIAFVSMSGTRGGIAGILLGMLAVPASGPATAICPPLALLAGPAAGSGVSALKGASVDALLVISIAAQAALGAIFFIGAGRRFRQPGATAMRRDLGFALVALWSTCAVIAMGLWGHIRPRWLGVEGLSPAHMAGTIVPAMLWGLTPVIASARVSGVRRLAGVETSWAGRWLWVADVLLVVAIVVLPTLYGVKLLAQSLGSHAPLAVDAVVTSAVSCLAWFLAMAAVARWAYARTLAGGLIVGGAGVLFLGLPALAQWAVSLISPGDSFDHQPHFIQCSPMANVIMAWMHATPDSEFDTTIFPHVIRVGLAVQLTFAVCCLWFFRLPSKFRRSGPAPGADNEKPATNN
jgi:hypothetical protein